MTTMYRKVEPKAVAPVPNPAVTAALAAWDAIVIEHQYDYSFWNNGPSACTCGRQFSHARGMSVHYTNTRKKAHAAYEDVLATYTAKENS